jgi:hypothetical protein
MSARVHQPGWRQTERGLGGSDVDHIMLTGTALHAAGWEDELLNQDVKS